MKRVLIVGCLFLGGAFLLLSASDKGEEKESAVVLHTTTDPYKKCVACHGINGEKVALNKSKIISEMTKQEIKDSLIGYQEGTYGGPMKSLMVTQMKGITLDQIDVISEKIGK